MIINHQTNVGGFAGAHIYLWPGQWQFGYRISETSAGATLTPTNYYFNSLLAG